MNTQARKRCSECRQDFPSSAFGRAGKASLCKVCASLRRAEREGQLFDPTTGRLHKAPYHTPKWLRALLPVLAADLAHRVALRDTPPADVGAVNPTVRKLCAGRELLTAEQWKRAVELVHSGMQTRKAIKKAGISRSVFERYLNISPALRQEWASAKRVRDRRRLPLETVMQILATIRGTSLSTRQAVLACTRGTALRNLYAAFIQRTLREPGLAGEYLAAKHAQSFKLREELFEDADDAAQAVAATWNAAAVRSVKRQYNQTLHRLDQIQPRRVANRQRAIDDPRAAALTTARRRAAHARRRSGFPDR